MGFRPTDADLNAWGFDLRPGIGSNFPDLQAAIRSLVANRISRIPWAPDGMVDAYMSFSVQAPGDVITPLPVLNTLGSRNYNAPAWLDTAEKLNVWQQIANEVGAAIVRFIAEERIAGANKLAALEADSAFWGKVAGGVEAAGAGIAAGATTAGKGIGSGATYVGKGLGAGYKAVGEGAGALLEGAGSAVKSVGGGLADGVKWVIILAAVAGAIYLYVQYKGIKGITGAFKAK